MNHGVVWIGKGLKDHLIPNPLPWAGIIDQEGDSLLVGLRGINVTARPWLSSILLAERVDWQHLQSWKLVLYPTQFLHSQQGQIPNLGGFMD